MKGIVLAGGRGTRLHPLTVATCKQLLPVYDKPMIYYPIATLMASGIREILLITNPDDSVVFKNLLGTGHELGVEFSYAVQEKPEGIGQAFIIGEHFIQGSNSALVLGDNIFHGSGLGRELAKHQNISGAHIFGYEVSNPSEYGVLEISDAGIVLSVEEKPVHPKSNLAIPGLYFYDSEVSTIAKSIKPSARGELEITEINNQYMLSGKLNATILPRGTAWFDMGTFDSLQDAGNYVRILEQRQNLRISCLEEIAWRQNWIGSKELELISNANFGTTLGSYLANLLK
jgi:glucose-1-phosphate thymidylyltransferase